MPRESGISERVVALRKKFPDGFVTLAEKAHERLEDNHHDEHLGHAEWELRRHMTWAGVKGKLGGLLKKEQIQEQKRVTMDEQEQRAHLSKTVQFTTAYARHPQVDKSKGHIGAHGALHTHIKPPQHFGKASAAVAAAATKKEVDLPLLCLPEAEKRIKCRVTAEKTGGGGWEELDINLVIEPDPQAIEANQVRRRSVLQAWVAAKETATMAKKEMEKLSVAEQTVLLSLRLSTSIARHVAR